MKRKTILKSIVIILLVVEVISLYLLSKPDNKVVLDDVLTMPLKNKRQTLAVMVQQEDNTWKEAENRNVWPSSTTHGFVGSRCYDGNGALVESTDIIQFDLSTYTATINTTSSVYCTLYFAKGTPPLELLKQKGGTTFANGNLTAVDGMYRFKGKATEVTHNYICFGTTNLSKCTSNPENYMYRVIGVTSEDDNTIGLKANQLKIIKATPSSTSCKWHSSNIDIKWDASIMKTYLNTTFLNDAISTKWETGEYWERLITSHSWYNADFAYLPDLEPTTSYTEESQIGLMYATDYKNAGETNTNNWLYIKNGWSTNSTLKDDAIYEWTMSRHASGSAWSVGGSLSKTGMSSSFSARPVFYLQSEINLSGEGTKENPFIISGVMPQS